jgi:16S rRNA C967 or C1407 C5-methylase (RsmB/RsmF family)
LDERENDGVIEKFLKKNSNNFQAVSEWKISVKEKIPGAEDTNHGMIILPDKTNGHGPLYICHLAKL